MVGWYFTFCTNFVGMHVCLYVLSVCVSCLSIHVGLFCMCDVSDDVVVRWCVVYQGLLLCVVLLYCGA